MMAARHVCRSILLLLLLYAPAGAGVIIDPEPLPLPVWKTTTTIDTVRLPTVRLVQVQFANAAYGWSVVRTRDFDPKDEQKAVDQWVAGETAELEKLHAAYVEITDKQLNREIVTASGWLVTLTGATADPNAKTITCATTITNPAKTIVSKGEYLVSDAPSVTAETLVAGVGEWAAKIDAAYEAKLAIPTVEKAFAEAVEATK